MAEKSINHSFFVILNLPWCQLILMTLIFFKPENILLNDDQTIKLSDFGFAKQLESGETLSGKRNALFVRFFAKRS